MSDSSQSDYVNISTLTTLPVPPGLKDQLGSIEPSKWNKVGMKLWPRLSHDPNREKRIHSYYLPVFFWSLELIKKLKTSDAPVFIGICGPQGSGKSTLTQFLVELLPEFGLSGVTLSIDDFYLTREEQVRLASEHPKNPLLQQRGYPGTHDISLGLETLEALKEINVNRTAILPKYEKSLNEGQGDRLPDAHWERALSPLSAVFLEGWMLGFKKVPESSLPDPAFREINLFLDQYESWYGFFDGFILMTPDSISDIVDWRVEAEEKRKAEGKAGLSLQEITDYIGRFLPAYKTYLPQLLANPIRSEENTLTLTLAKNRLPLL